LALQTTVNDSIVTVLKIATPFALFVGDRVSERLKRVKKAVRVALRHVAGRDASTCPDDIFIVSYPKSGNTWMRFLIGNLFWKDGATDFSNLEQRVPDIYRNVEKALQSRPRPRLLKSHEPFDPRYKKLIYIVRDPRDVLVSYYFHELKFRTIDESVSILDFTERFLNGDVNPSFGSWAENAGSWIGARQDTPGFLLLRYEDLKTDTIKNISPVADFIGGRSPEMVRKAVEACTAERMRELERTQGQSWDALKKTRKDIPFVRSAVAGGWREHLDSAITSEMERRWGKLMRTLGYLS
jgi:hypothetical protein